ncbi:MAG: PAS domain-containing protein [bacterium]|nr:PAS domain-containing protein [bacterium]
MKETFLESLISRLDHLDPNNMQAFILRLVKQNGFLETIFNAIKEGVIVIDRNLNIHYANKCAVDMLGVPDNIKEQRISTFLRDIDWSRILQEDEEEWYRISSQDVKVFYPTKRVLNFYIVPNEEDQELATIILRDITEKKRSELENFESEKIQMMSMLAAGVAHEIGNPLNSLNIHLQLLERNFRDKLDDEAKEILAITKTEVKRLDLIITQFLTAIRPQKPSLVEIDLKELLDETVRFMSNEFEEHNIDIDSNFPKVLPYILADSNQLKQVFFNLLKNAMQAMPSGGIINIKAVLDKDKDCIKLSIADTGCGISAKDMTNVFEPYYTKKNKGTGLGLMIVERIVREHGAELAVESEPGKGTHFIISFPLRTHRVKLLESYEESQQNIK